MISVVIEAWRTRFMVSVSESISSPAFLVALSIAVMRAACSAATDSSRALEDELLDVVRQQRREQFAAARGS